VPALFFPNGTAFNPGPANLQVASGRVFAPRPFGPAKGARRDIFEDAIMVEYFRQSMGVESRLWNQSAQAKSSVEQALNVMGAIQGAGSVDAMLQCLALAEAQGRQGVPKEDTRGISIRGQRLIFTHLFLAERVRLRCAIGRNARLHRPVAQALACDKTSVIRDVLEQTCPRVARTVNHRLKPEPRPDAARSKRWDVQKEVGNAQLDFGQFAGGKTACIQG
jgi:hypothetical protein